MKIGVIGLGIVGKAVYDGLGQFGHQMSHYDIVDQTTNIDSVMNTEIVFVCVPTPTNNEGFCDISNVEHTVDLLSKNNYSGIVAIKSTVIPGTTQRAIEQYQNLKICFVPEFLRERSALIDFVELQDVLIIGTQDNEIYQCIVDAHQSIPKSTCMVSPTEAEISKYFSNAFNALRITFANNMFDLCQSLGADYQNVFSAVSKRQVIGKEYLRCSHNFRGFGGSCLPKDTQALATLIKNLKLNHVTVIDSMIKDNQHYIKGQN